MLMIVTGKLGIKETDLTQVITSRKARLKADVLIWFSFQSELKFVRISG